MEKVIYFEKLRFLVVGTVHNYRVEYKIYDALYIDEDGTVMMPRKGSDFS